MHLSYAEGGSKKKKCANIIDATSSKRKKKKNVTLTQSNAIIHCRLGLIPFVSYVVFDDACWGRGRTFWLLFFFRCFVASGKRPFITY